MASLTKNDLKNELINRGIELSPASAKIAEENSLVVGDIDIPKLTDEELTEKLKEFNIAAGPVVESTRTLSLRSRRIFYEKELAISMRESMKIDTSIVDNVPDVENINLSEAYNDNDDAEKDEIKDAEYSADDEYDPYQLSCVDVSTSECSKSTISNDSPPNLRKPEEYSSLTKIHQRVIGSNKEASVVDGRHTPILRRSIQSYEVTETSKETVTKAKDGTISKDNDYEIPTSTSEEEIGSVKRFVKFLGTIFMLFTIAALGYSIYEPKEENKIALPAKYLMTKLTEFMRTVLIKSQDTTDNIETGNENPATM